MTKAWAHTSEAAAGVFGWSFEPLVSVPLAVVAVLYIAGSGQLSRRGKADRRREQVWFWLGFASLAFALCSPLHALGTRIFAAHMVEHEILMVISAPLQVLSRPGAALSAASLAWRTRRLPASSCVSRRAWPMRSLPW